MFVLNMFFVLFCLVCFKEKTVFHRKRYTSFPFDILIRFHMFKSVLSILDCMGCVCLCVIASTNPTSLQGHIRIKSCSMSVHALTVYNYPVWSVGGDVRLIACHIATGLRNDVNIWFQCLRPFSELEQPTITWPMGTALPIVLLFSMDVGVSGILITVKRIWMAFSIYGGTLNIIASL